MNYSLAKLVLLSAGLLLFRSTIQAQLTLNPGDEYTYQFTTLPHIQTVTGPEALRYADGGFFTLLGHGFGQFRMEMFENSSSEQPVSFREFTDPGYYVQAYHPNAWRDLQGTVRVTVDSGSLTINQFSLGENIVDWANSTAQLYGIGVQLVPEPSAICLFSLALLGLVVRRWTKNQPAIRVRVLHSVFRYLKKTTLRLCIFASLR